MPVMFSRMMTTIGTPSSQSRTLFMTRTPFSAHLRGKSIHVGTNKQALGFPHSLSSGIIFMHEIIYLVGLVVVVMFILSVLGLH
jgi:hypothetical protein